jgi:hypothetical protein
MDLIGIEDALPVHRNISAVRGACATGNQDVMAAQKLGSFLGFDLESVRIEEAGVALKRRNLITAKLRLDDFNLSRHHRLCSKNEIRHCYAILEDIAASVETALPKATQVQNSFTQRFAGDGSGVDTNTADCSFPVNDGNFFSQFGGADRTFLSRRAASDYYQVVLVDFHSLQVQGSLRVRSTRRKRFRRRISIHPNSVLSSLRNYHQVFANKSELEAVTIYSQYCAAMTAIWQEALADGSNPPGIASNLDELGRRRFRRLRVCPQFKG